MYGRATNNCQWIYTKRANKSVCNRACVGQLCSYHIQQKRIVGNDIANICSNCGMNGTRSRTGLCMKCGGKKASINISSKAYYHRKKLEKQLENTSTTLVC